MATKFGVREFQSDVSVEHAKGNPEAEKATSSRTMSVIDSTDESGYVPQQRISKPKDPIRFSCHHQ